MRTIKLKRKPLGYWYKERVEAVIKDRVSKGLSVSPKDMIREDKGAYVAAWRTHGSWDRALIATGISLDILGVAVEEKILKNCLKQRMQEQNMSQKELATRIGVSPTLIKSWQDGTYNPSLEKA